MPSNGWIVERERQKESLEKKGKRQILVFTLANVEWGLDISCVREVLRPRKITPLPKTPDFVEGVINLRGYVLALIDLSKRLISKPIEEESNKRIIVCRIGKSIVGLSVNSLKEIITISDEDMIPTPEVVSMRMEAEVISRIARIGERIIPILDLEHILTKKEVTELSAFEQ